MLAAIVIIIIDDGRRRSQKTLGSWSREAGFCEESGLLCKPRMPPQCPACARWSAVPTLLSRGVGITLKMAENCCVLTLFGSGGWPDRM